MKTRSSQLTSLTTNKKMLNLSTKIKSEFWYCQYQALVLTLPSVGTHATKRWYSRYQALVGRLPSIGSEATNHWYACYQTSVRPFVCCCITAATPLYSQYKAFVLTFRVVLLDSFSICCAERVDKNNAGMRNLFTHSSILPLFSEHSQVVVGNGADILAIVGEPQFGDNDQQRVVVIDQQLFWVLLQFRILAHGLADVVDKHRL